MLIVSVRSFTIIVTNKAFKREKQIQLQIRPDRHHGVQGMRLAVPQAGMVEIRSEKRRMAVWEPLEERD
jgi:hypothetical protein